MTQALNKAAASEQTLLPENKSDALKALIRLSEKIIGLSEQETQALIQNDLAVFALLQREKSVMAVNYAKASEEFRGRYEEFRAADPGLLDRLDNLQKDMGEKLRSNNEIVTRMFKRSKKKTSETLLTVQELAQQKPIKMNNEDNRTGA
ncbi:MAG: hypothetical protein KDJ35_02095 [Alphaproteobacteria bacterium]|nr:hypothetical protein [Alphaproteobacteria bacterium]